MEKLIRKLKRHIAAPCSILYSALAGVFLLSCGNESTPDMGEGNGVEIAFHASMATPSATVDNTRSVTIFNNDFGSESISFGIALTKYGSTDDPIMIDTGNMESILNPGSGSWSFIFDGETHEKLSIRENLGFSAAAYYPFRKKDFDDTTNVTPDRVPFTSCDADYLWAEPVDVARESITGEKAECELKFKHVMTCICLRIKCDHSSSLELVHLDLTDVKARDKGESGILYKEGHFDARTGNIDMERATKTNTLAMDCNITLRQNVTTPVYIVIPPVEGYEDKRFEVTLKFKYVNDTETLKLPSKMKKDGVTSDITKFNAGYMYTYEVEFDNNLSFIAPEVSENEWSTGETTKFTL